MTARPIIGFAAALLMAWPPLRAAEPPATHYTSARITAPANGEGLRANSGDLVVQAHVEPSLGPGHGLRLLLDGHAQGNVQTSLAFPLTAVDRGEHQLQLQIVNEDGDIVFAGETSTFHLLRHSILHQRSANAP